MPPVARWADVALPESTAGLPGWTVLASGFALLAAGFPLSSLALFGFLAVWAMKTHTPWWAAGVLAGTATALGHVASYVAFARLGPSLLHLAIHRVPILAGPVSRLRLILASRQPWPSLLLLRWVGVGYAQVFWVLGALGIGGPPLLALLLVNDLVWGLVWAYATLGLVTAAPVVGQLLSLGALVVLVTSVVAGAWQFCRHRRSDGTS